MTTKKESFTDLISQAEAMLRDRSKQEADLIFSIAKLEDDLRAAIIFAYNNIHDPYEEIDDE